MLQWKVLTNKVGNLLVGAEHYFGQKFDSLDGLIEHFRKSGRPVVVSDVAKPEEKVKTLNDDLNSKKRKKAEAKAKKLQIELKALKTENASLSEKVKALDTVPQSRSALRSYAPRTVTSSPSAHILISCTSARLTIRLTH